MKHPYTFIKPAVITLVAAVAVSGCSGSPEAGAAAGVPVQVVRVGGAVSGGLSGKIIPEQEVKIVSKLSGKVAAVLVEEGARVSKGDVLIQLESDDFAQQVKQAESAVAAARAKLDDVRAGARPEEIKALESSVTAAQGAYEQATAAVEQAKAGLELATSSYNRLKNKYDSSSSVTEEDLDKGTLEYEKAKAGYEQALAAQKGAAGQLEAAKAKLEQARSGATENTIKALEAEVNRLNAALELATSNLSNAAITAPADGVIVKKSISPGEMAQPGSPILTLVNMDSVMVELSVADNQISQIKTGSAVSVKVHNVPDQTFAGTVVFVSPVSNPNSNTFPVKVKVDNKDGLLFAGMVAEVSLDGAQDGRLELPKSAVVQKDGKEFVFTVDNGTARLVEVTTEPKNENWVYVQANGKVKSNDPIVANPSDQLAEGTKVTAR